MGAPLLPPSPHLKTTFLGSVTMDYPSDEILIARGKASTLNRKRRHLMKELQSYCQRAQSANTRILSYANDSNISEGLPKTDELGMCVTAMEKIQIDLQAVLDELAEVNVTAWGA